MRLYVYLVSISKFEGRNKPRTFRQSDFTVNKIKDVLHMHPNTVKKYWRLLEENGLIKYEGPIAPLAKVDEDAWFKDFSERRKRKGYFYSIFKRNPYRIMPRETITLIQEKGLVNEQELKIFLLLANMQEHFCYLQSPDRCFSLNDLRDLLKLKKDDKVNKEILHSLAWLKEIELIDYKIVEGTNNLGMPLQVFELVSVNYYIGDDNKVSLILQSEGNYLTDELKSRIMNEQLIEFE